MFANSSSLFALFTFLFLCLTSTQARMVNDDTAILARHFGGVSGVVQGAVSKRATLLSPPVCTDKAVQLSSHDCNVALLSTGTGISGAVEFLRVAATTTTGTSGNCAVTVTAINGGTAIDVSKGRFEQGFKSFKAVCGVSPGTVDVQGGSTGGDIRITVSKN